MRREPIKKVSLELTEREAFWLLRLIDKTAYGSLWPRERAALGRVGAKLGRLGIELPTPDRDGSAP